MAVNYNDGKWHGWHGGKCPVHPDTVVEVRLGDREYEGPDMEDRANGWVWEIIGDQGIIAFRVIKEHREPRELSATMAYVHNSPNKVYVIVDGAMYPLRCVTDVSIDDMSAGNEVLVKMHVSVCEFETHQEVIE